MLVALQTERWRKQLAVLRLVHLLDVEDLRLGTLKGMETFQVLFHFAARGVGVAIGLVQVAYFLETDLLLQVLEPARLAVAGCLEIGRKGREAEGTALATHGIALVGRPVRGVRLTHVDGGGRVRLHELTVFLVDVN